MVRQAGKCHCSDTEKSVRTGILPQPSYQLLSHLNFILSSQILQLFDALYDYSLFLLNFFRGRLKSKKFTGVTSNMEMYFSHQVKAHASNGNSSRSSTSSPPQPRLPQASGGSADSQLKIALPVDLNHKGKPQIFSSNIRGKE